MHNLAIYTISLEHIEEELTVQPRIHTRQKDKRGGHLARLRRPAHGLLAAPVLHAFGLARVDLDGGVR